MGILQQGFLLLRGTVTRDIEIQRVLDTVPHTPDPNPDAAAASRLTSMMRKKSGTSRCTQIQILVDTPATATTEIVLLQAIPNLSTVPYVGSAPSIFLQIQSNFKV